jgi:carboxylesterase
MKPSVTQDGFWGRIAALVLLPIVGVFFAAFFFHFGFAALVWAAAVIVLIAGFLIWNLKPVFYKPSSVRPPAATADRLMHPDAAPIEAFHGHKDLLLCLHGFPATPADYRNFLPEADVLGYDLAAPLLPGCGTNVEDLKGQTFDTFLSSVRQEYLRLRPRYERVFLVGQSLGGSLALALAEEFCAVPALAPSAVATIGAPVVLNSLLRHGMVRHPVIYGARFLGLFTPAIKPHLPDPNRSGEDGDRRWLGYLGIYPETTFSIQLRLPEIERKLRRVTCPILICHARGDRMSDYRNAAIIARGVGADRIESYTANMDRFHHIRHSLLIYDSQRDKVRERVFRFFGEFRE